MDRAKAINFLKRHQPMPPDYQLTDRLITEYDEVLEYCNTNPDTEFIPLLLNSFGERGGFGVYQLVGNCICRFEPEQVVPNLLQSLASKHPAVRYWSAQIATNFPSPVLVEPLSGLLQDEDEDIRLAAALAMEKIDEPRVNGIIEHALKNEKDAHVRALLLGALETRRRNLIAVS
ncbi:MAG: HEAT repeat domain-containing protein [Armatimonadota bacterium]